MHERYSGRSRPIAASIAPPSSRASTASSGDLLSRPDLERRGLHRLGRLGVGRAVERQGVELPAPQVIDGRVVGDLEDPGGELELRPVRVDGVERLDERLLRQVLGQLPVAHHAEEQGEHRPLVAPDQLPVRRLPARPGEQHHLLIGEPGPVRRRSAIGVVRLAKALAAGLHCAPMLASDRKLPVSGGPEKRAYVREMFTAIAPTYDLLNRILSLRFDQRWRRHAVGRLGWERVPEGMYLDLCAGTLDFGGDPGARSAGFAGGSSAPISCARCCGSGRAKSRPARRR